MRVSIVTISYNQAPFLRECIESVLDQCFDDLEYIVVDPGSTDGSREIIDSYGDRIRRVYERDIGPADGLNKGFAIATGDVFAFLNADDVLLSGAVKYMADCFALRPDIDVLCGCGYIIDADGSRRRRVTPSRFTPWLYARGAVTVFQQGVFFRAESYRRVGGFNVDNRTCWDGELFLDMAVDGARCARVLADLALFRIYDGSITGSGRLSEGYRMDHERLFLRTIGRRRGAVDHYIDQIARLVKYASDPTYLKRRIAAR